MYSRLTVRDAVADLALACRIASRVRAREGRITDPAMRQRLEDAAVHLNRLELYPRPIDLSRVTLYHAPWFFTMRHNRGFIGVAMRNRLLIMVSRTHRETHDRQELVFVLLVFRPQGWIPMMPHVLFGEIALSPEL